MKKILLARILIAIGALFPITVGTYYYIIYIRLPGLHLIEHVAFTNLLASGIAILTLTLFAFKTMQLWAIALLTFLTMWVGGNDSYILLNNFVQHKNIFPYAIIPFILSCTGLFILSKEISLDE
jgi:hypothetical protein